jgi:1-phosphatidylinositol-3-phosphate 5-kinase
MTNFIRRKIIFQVQFSDSSSNFFCRVFFVEQFAALRQMVLPTGEEGFVRSLTRCVQWAARGGKSGSTFCKTRGLWKHQCTAENNKL